MYINIQGDYLQGIYLNKVFILILTGKNFGNMQFYKKI